MKKTIRGSKRKKVIGNGICYYCGSSNADTIDHKIAIKHGGTNAYSNLVCACLLCNTVKGDMSYTQFKMLACLGKMPELHKKLLEKWARRKHHHQRNMKKQQELAKQREALRVARV